MDCKTSVYKLKKIPFTVSVNINTAIDESDTTSLADTAVMSDDYCVLDLPDNYSLDEPCKLVMYLHGAGGSINAAGTGEGTNLTDYLLTFGYAVLRVNGLPSGFYEEGMRIGGSFGIPVACDCHYPYLSQHSGLVC